MGKRTWLSALLMIMATLPVTSCGAKLACKETLGGVKCGSLSEVYETEIINRGEKLPEESRQNEKRTKGEEKGNTSGAQGSNNDSDSIVKKLELEGRHPLRIPPKVVAIWIAPWEDTEGDLHEQKFIYMEITPKEGRWVLGEKVVDTRSHRLKRIDDISPANETTEAPGTGNKAGQIKNRTDNRNLPPPGRKEPVFVK